MFLAWWMSSAPSLRIVRPKISPRSDKDARLYGCRDIATTLSDVATPLNAARESLVARGERLRSVESEVGVLPSVEVRSRWQASFQGGMQ
jgi:hypothetical protein